MHLQRGIVAGDDQNVCYACAGTLLLEFATLSRLTGEPVFEVSSSAVAAACKLRCSWPTLPVQAKARAALDTLHERRHPSGLVGRLINTQTGNVDSGTSECVALPRLFLCQICTYFCP